MKLSHARRKGKGRQRGSAVARAGSGWRAGMLPKTRSSAGSRRHSQPKTLLCQVLPPCWHAARAP